MEPVNTDCARAVSPMQWGVVHPGHACNADGRHGKPSEGGELCNHHSLVEVARRRSERRRVHLYTKSMIVLQESRFAGTSMAYGTKKPPPQSEERFSDEEAARRLEAALRGARLVGHKPMKTIPSKRKNTRRELKKLT